MQSTIAERMESPDSSVKMVQIDGLVSMFCCIAGLLNYNQVWSC